jgi:hypothetical protein
MAALQLKQSRNILLIIFITLVIFLGGTIALHAVSPPVKAKLANGLLADFVITFPALYYFIIIRPSKASVKRLLIIISICCGIAYLVLPQQQREYLLQIRKLTAVAELGFIIYAFTKFNILRKAYKEHQLTFADPVYNFRSAMAATMGESVAIKIIASELAVLRYGLLCWKKERSALNESQAFSTHKEFGYIAIWCMLMVAILVEMTAFHLLLMRWSHTAAIILTALSAYGIIFFIADLSAIVKRKVLINNSQVILRVGLRWQIITSRDNIDTIKKITNDYNGTGEYFKGGIIKSSGNLFITFKNPVQVNKLYGSTKETRSVLMHIDNYELFAAAIGVGE